jgi:hypothetical protein
VVRPLAFTALTLISISTLASLPGSAGGRLARAGTCPPAVELTGDADAVRAVRAELDARGIAGETPSCPAVRARIERRGPLLVVGIVPGAPERPAGGPGAVPGAVVPGPVIERTVGEPATAATVIESWARTDLAAPLLETRVVPAIEVAPAVVAAPAPAAQGIQLSLSEETSLASDHTVWQGMQLGACVMLGPICAAARVHAGKVIARPAGWDGFVRKGAEAYLGIDIPIAAGRLRLTPGFAAGYGTMLTHHIGDGDEKTGIELSGPRAEAHVALAIPVTPHIAIDLATTAELTQMTGVEAHGSAPSPDAAILYPDAPRALFRFAIGVRYGAP